MCGRDFYSIYISSTHTSNVVANVIMKPQIHSYLGSCGTKAVTTTAAPSRRAAITVLNLLIVAVLAVYLLRKAFCIESE